MKTTHRLVVIDTEMAVKLPPSGTAPSLGYTEHYAAPEAIGDDGVVNATTDIFSAGRILIENVRDSASMNMLSFKFAIASGCSG